eukprot:gnl/TRDRNA2_/TRDRNA2_166500_c0_seq1.p1 gnl/TRDRNA2_/TRDRNA2_166500_c0~~gnl/TRDRNA2_/TRDRNA2_166500_c0_seq1.p1  ORF type:complete len:452 (+),score=50.87 gnl/TRDRNA2_/TRDRNA2_166500_c0_seq1:309-1664(+)
MQSCRKPTLRCNGLMMCQGALKREPVWARLGEPDAKLQKADVEMQRADDVPRSPQERARLGAAKLNLMLQKEEVLDIQRNSVYGASLMMPQFARSTGWMGNFTVLAIRNYCFLVLNVLIQWFIVYSLMKEQMVMDRFAGQMNLCDFGSKKSGCPDADGCVGPGGTRITAPRLYSYVQWYLQNFVKSSFIALFPDREDDINSMIDAGEYGLESWHVRYLSTFIFVMTALGDLYQVFGMFELVCKIPTAAESWVDYDGDVCVLRIAGMPLSWKIISTSVVVLPKMLLWVFTLRSGIMFLMETAGIDNTIVNSTALAFILTIDELIFETVTTVQTRRMMADVQPFVVSKALPVEATDTDEQIIEKSGARRWWMNWFPKKLFLCAVLWIILTVGYYLGSCDRSPDGTWVSKTMYYPKSTDYSHLSALFPYLWPVEHESDPYWSMPPEKKIGKQET